MTDDHEPTIGDVLVAIAHLDDRVARLEGTLGSLAASMSVAATLAHHLEHHQ